MRPNRFRQLLREGRPTFGTHLFTMWPTIVEVVGHTGNFDYIEFSGEYAPYDLNQLENWVRATELFGMSSMIKLDQEPRTWLSERAIGAGFQSVLFADIRTADEVRAAVKAVRADVPGGGGIHGVADRRAALMLHAGQPRYIQALNDVVIGIMIEKASAVEQLDEILAVPGVDMIQWGPADYSMSVGKPGGWYDPEVQRVERDVFERCIKAGIPPRAELNHPKDVAKFLEMGVKDFCMGTDLYVIYDWMRDNGRVLRSSVEAVYGASPSNAIGPAWETMHAAGGAANGHETGPTPVADTAEARPPHA
jgi:2-keto-3-deoxy-L-rhamnonate aldolase RhmA